MPYRSDHVRLPVGAVEVIRRSAQPVKTGVGYSSPGDTVEGYVQAAVRQPTFYARAFGRGVQADGDYEDGSGDDVAFGFRRDSQQLVLGYTPSPAVEVFGVFLRDDIADDETPSAGLDNVETDRLVGRGGFDLRNGYGPFDRLRFETRLRDAERTNNNFDLRDFTIGAGNRRVQVENERRFFDGRLFGDFKSGAIDHRLGLDWIVEHRDGSRLIDLNAASAEPQLDGLGARLFPDILIGELGPSWEAAFSPSENDHFRWGIGYRAVLADARDVNAVGDGVFATLAAGIAATPANAYDFYYGNVDEEQTDHLVNARLLYQLEMLEDRATVFAELARTDRAADSKERYFAALTPPAQAANRLVGNPELNPERHHQAALGVAVDGKAWRGFGRSRATGETFLSDAWSLAAAVRYSHVQDFITRDRARLQSGVLQNDQALVFRNVDVDMVTAEVDGRINLTRRIAARANIIATYAENRTDNRALYGIAPLEANMLVEYANRIGTIGDWAVGGKLRLVGGQDRVDANAATGAGFDEGETGGFGVVDLYADFQFFNRAALRVGIENLLDKTYQEHVARDTLESRQRLRVNAPGRSLYLRAIMNF